MNKNQELYEIESAIELKIGEIVLNVAQLKGVYAFLDELSLEADKAEHRGHSVRNLNVKLYTLVKSLERATKAIDKSEIELTETQGRLHKYLKDESNKQKKSFKRSNA